MSSVVNMLRLSLIALNLCNPGVGDRVTYNPAGSDELKAVTGRCGLLCLVLFQGVGEFADSPLCIGISLTR